RERHRRRPLLDREDARGRARNRGRDGDPVHGVGGEHDRLAALQRSGRVVVHGVQPTVGTMSDLIRYDVDDNVATITIDRPEKKGAMTYAMLGEFIAAVHRAGRDDAARAVIVTGAPGTFCAGTDLADLATVPGTERSPRGDAEQTDVWWPIVQCPKPVIAAV